MTNTVDAPEKASGRHVSSEQRRALFALLEVAADLPYGDLWFAIGYLRVFAGSAPRGIARRMRRRGDNHQVSAWASEAFCYLLAASAGFVGAVAVALGLSGVARRLRGIVCAARACAVGFGLTREPSGGQNGGRTRNP
jgi:hypothetical protein